MSVPTLVDVPTGRAEAILGAMRAVALEHGGLGLTEMDRETIGSAALIVLGLGEVDVDAITVVDPATLATQIESTEDARQAVRMLSVMSLADGVADVEKTALVAAYADGLDVSEDYLDVLTEAAADEIAQAAACLVRKNAESFPHLDSSRLAIGATAPFFPYKDAPDRELEACYSALGELEEATFGRHFLSTSTATASSPPVTRTASPRGSRLPTTAPMC